MRRQSHLSLWAVSGLWYSAAGAALIPHPALLCANSPQDPCQGPHPRVYGSVPSPQDLWVSRPRYTVFANHLCGQRRAVLLCLGWLKRERREIWEINGIKIPCG